MFGTLSPEEIEKVPEREIICRLGCHADDTTYVVPISYAYDGAYIYGHTSEGMETNMLRKNPNVCFQVDCMRNMANWQSVIAWGEYEELPGGIERNRALHHLNDRILPILTSKTVQLTPQWPFPSIDFESVKGVVYRIRIHKKSGRFESNTESFGIG